MTLSIHSKKTLRLGSVLIPGAILVGLAATTFLVLGDLRSESGQSLPPLRSGDVADIEFLSQDSASLRESIAAACAGTGCDAETVHSMILATTSRMTADELRDGLRDQARDIAAHHASMRGAVAAGDPAGVERARQQAEAAGNIAAAYRSALRRLGATG